jgi:hypothetical protein
MTMSSKKNLPPAAAERPEVVDPLNCQVAFADWIVTAGCHENVVNLTLGAIDHAILGDNGQPRIIVVSRLRFSRDVGLRLHNLLGRVLGVTPPSAPSTPDTPVPKNQLN